MTGPGVLVVAPAALAGAGWLVAAARRRGLVPGAPDDEGRKHYYGGPRFADRVAHVLGVGLLEPADEWLGELPEVYTRRAVHLTTVATACASPGPVFVKPPTGKDFPAAAHAGGREVAAQLAHLPADTVVQVSEVVEFAAEYRLFLLDGTVHTGSRYATWGGLDPCPLDDDPEAGRVRGFVDAALADSLPSGVVLDVGLLGPPQDPRRHVAVVEANMAWFARPYRCDVDRVLDVVLRAAGPEGEVRARDRRFLRPRDAVGHRL